MSEKNNEDIQPCETCHWWRNQKKERCPKRLHYPQDGYVDTGKIVGHCLSGPPTAVIPRYEKHTNPIVTAVWPITYADYGCGAHKPKKEETQ